MKALGRVLVGATALVVVMAVIPPALAQTAPVLANVVSTCGTPNGAAYVAGQNRPTTQTTGGLGCVNTVPSGTQSVSIQSWTAVAGTQTNLAIATATAPTMPATATIIVVTPEGTNGTTGICARWRDDGTDPTASTGQPMAALSVLVYKAAATPIKFIAATGASCTITISYFKVTP